MADYNPGILARCRPPSSDALLSVCGEPRTTIISADVGKLPELGFIPETSAIFNFWSNFGAAQGGLETHKRNQSNDLD